MFEWLQIFPKTNTTYKLISSNSSLEFAAQTIAIEKAIDLIANMISKCEFRTYVVQNKKVVEQFDKAYYTLNVRPNPNKVGSEFWKEVVKKAYHDFEVGALVVQYNGYLYLAESWDWDDKALVAKTFKNVIVGGLPLKMNFSMDDAMFYKINNADVARLMVAYYQNMAKIISYAMNDYHQKNGLKLIAKMPNAFKVKDPVTNEDLPIQAQTYLDSLFRQLFEADNVVVPVAREIEVSLLGDKIPSKDSSDVRSLIRHVFEDVATAFHIPRDIFFGTKTEKSTSMTDLLTFAVDNPLQLLEDVLNAKQVKQVDYLKGERIIIDKTRMQHFDIVDSANSMDKMFSIGFSHNDIRRWLGMPGIDEPWANEHNITKNYSAPTAGEGGDGK